MTLKKTSRVLISKTSDKNSKKKKEINTNNYKNISAISGYSTLFIVITLLIIDRLTKIWALSLENNSIDLGIIEFTYTVNTGAGFSIFNNMNAVLTVITTIIAIILIYYYNNKSNNKLSNKNSKESINIPKFSFITIISGTIGNILDRIFHGGVIDFINLKFWPIFNIADSLIFIGVAYWIIILIREK